VTFSLEEAKYQTVVDLFQVVISPNDKYICSGGDDQKVVCKKLSLVLIIIRKKIVFV
jgi:hypothetical protein